jgi:dipeptidyl aminopeptidase/acylaminoacyl peptidase
VPGGDFEPAWSPDGTQIAFTSFRDGNMQIYAINLSDQKVTRLSKLDGTAEARQAAWMPSGDRISFTARRLGIYQIWAMDRNGANPGQIIRSGKDFWDYAPAWSGDGKVVIFSQRSAGGLSAPWQMRSPYNKAGSIATRRIDLGSLAAEGAAVRRRLRSLQSGGPERQHGHLYGLPPARNGRSDIGSALDFDLPGGRAQAVRV